MSKNSLSQMSTSQKIASKQKGTPKGSYGKLTLDLNKIDARPNTVSSPMAQDKILHSPTSPSEKATLLYNTTKTQTQRAKQNPAGFIFENFDVRDASSVDKKLYSQTPKISHIGMNYDKSKKSFNFNDKAVTSKLKEYQMKGLFPGYEVTNTRKTPRGTENNKTSLAFHLADSKGKIMEEPHKKYSVPSTMSYSLHGTYHGVGSSSHRGPLNSPKQDQSSVNNGPYVYMPFQRKNSQRSDIEQDQIQTNSLVYSTKHAHTTYGVNLMTEVPSTTQAKKGVSKINMTNVTNVSAVNNVSVEEKVSPKGTAYNLQYADLIKLLNEKDKEIQKLNQDKTELSHTLNTMNGDVTNSKTINSILKEKDQMIADLQKSLTVAVKESDVLKKELQKESIIPVDTVDDDLHDRNSTIKSATISVDMEGIKALIGQYKTLTNERTTETSDSNGNLFGDSLKKSQPSRSKKSSGSTLPNSEVQSVKNSRMPSSDVHANNKMKANNSIVIKRKDSAHGTPRDTLTLSDQSKSIKQIKVQPNTTTGADADILKRKLSHDPRQQQQNYNIGILAKKNSVVESASMLSKGNTSKVTAGEGLDIAKGLNEIKNKVAMLLNHHRNDINKLKKTQEMYLHKLEEYLKN